jgi:hypothetical protein
MTEVVEKKVKPARQYNNQDLRPKRSKLQQSSTTGDLNKAKILIDKEPTAGNPGNKFDIS